MQQITLTFQAHGENMSQDTDQETAKTIKAAGGVDGAGPSRRHNPPPFPLRHLPTPRDADRPLPAAFSCTLI